MQIEAPFDRYRTVVPPEWIDYNGHMNVAYYLLAFDQASDVFFEDLGLGETHRRATGGSTFAVEHHIRYLRELKQGDPIRITGQLLSHDEKRFRFFMFMYHGEEGYPAATLEALGVYVDLETRRVAAMPASLHARLAEVCAAHRSLPFPKDAGRAIAVPPLAEPVSAS